MRQLLKDHPELAKFLPKAKDSDVPHEQNGKTTGNPPRNNKATRGPKTREYCQRMVKALEGAKGGKLTVSELVEKIRAVVCLVGAWPPRLRSIRKDPRMGRRYVLRAIQLTRDGHGCP